MRVVIYSYTDESYSHVVGKDLTEAEANKVVTGVEINLDGERYYATVEKEAT